MTSEPSSPLVSWLLLARCEGLGPRAALRLVAELGGAQAIAGADEARLLSAGLGTDEARALCDPALRRACEREIARTLEGGAVLLHRDHPAYPPLLTELAVPPPVVTVVGDPHVLARPALAVVGSRAASDYGLAMTARIVGPLARLGIVIVSGLARGIDQAAHRAALDAGGSTVAVMGTGFDRIYPKEHTALSLEIAATGALITEFAPGTAPLPDHFPRRNRIIAGLSAAVLVVEAQTRSGSLVTASWATEQNRAVLTVPGRIGDPGSDGPHALLRDGATLVRSADDVLEEVGAFQGVLRNVLTGQGDLFASDPDAGAVDPRGVDAGDAQGHALGNRHPRPPAPSLAGLPQAAGPVLAAIPTDEPIPVDRLLEKLARPTDEILTALFGLELAGLVEVLPGARYRRKLTLRAADS